MQTEIAGREGGGGERGEEEGEEGGRERIRRGKNEKGYRGEGGE